MKKNSPDTSPPASHPKEQTASLAKSKGLSTFAKRALITGLLAGTVLGTAQCKPPADNVKRVEPARHDPEKARLERLRKLLSQSHYSPGELKERSELSGERHPLVTPHIAPDGEQAMLLSDYLAGCDKPAIDITREEAAKNLDEDSLNLPQSIRKKGLIWTGRTRIGNVIYRARKNRCADYVGARLLRLKKIEPSVIALIGRLLKGGARVVIDFSKLEKGDILVQTGTAWRKGKRITHRATHVAAIRGRDKAGNILIRDHIRTGKFFSPYKIANRTLRMKNPKELVRFLMGLRLKSEKKNKN